MIKTWIIEGPSNGSSLPSWSQLVEVVAASFGGQDPALASELANEHSTGMYDEQLTYKNPIM